MYVEDVGLKVQLNSKGYKRVEPATPVARKAASLRTVVRRETGSLERSAVVS